MTTPSYAPQLNQRLYFLWDYDFSEVEIRLILTSSNPLEKAWLITRILEYTKWSDIWDYLTVNEIHQNFEHLHFRRPQDRELWAYALDRWKQNA